MVLRGSNLFDTMMMKTGGCTMNVVMLRDDDTVLLCMLLERDLQMIGHFNFRKKSYSKFLLFKICIIVLLKI
jgi:hypothetical protein